MGLTVNWSYTPPAGQPNAGVLQVYQLKVETFDHMFTRFATQAPLPSAAAGQAGTNFWLDLGQEIEQITIGGVVDVVSTVVVPYVATYIPSKVQLENACRNWWVYTNAAVTDYSLFSQLSWTDDAGVVQTYAVEIKQADFQYQAGNPGRWTFSIVYMIGSKLAGG